MKRVFLTLFVICLASSMFTEPLYSTPPRFTTGFEELDVPFVPGPYRPHRDDADILGERIEAGETWYDYQANGTLSKMIAVDEDGGIHVVWMNAIDQGLADRHTYYNYIIDDEVQLDEGVEVDGSDRAGYNNMGYAPNVGAIPIFHTQIGGGENYWGNIAQDFDFGNGAWEVFQNPRDNDRNFVWPHGTVDRNGCSHVLSRLYPDVEGVLDLQYARGVPNDDDEWDFDDPVIIDRVKGIPYTAAASHVEDNVALVYVGQSFDHNNEVNRWLSWAGGAAMCTDIFIFESEDGEEFDWDNKINATRCMRPDLDADEDSPFYVGDTLRPYLMTDACYDNDNNLHVVFCTGSMVENPDPNAANGWLRYNDKSCYVWHWDRDSGEIHFLADGWWTPADNGQIGAWRMNLSYPSIGVDEDNNLYCAFTYFPPEGDLGAVAPNGLRYINGEVYVSKSTDGGQTWSQAVNVTETNANNAQAGEAASECWSTLAEVVNDYLHISYVLDLDPGGIPQAEGVATLNPFMYHRVPVEEIPSEPKVLGRDFHVGWPPEIAVDADLPVIPGVPEGEPGSAPLGITNSNEDGTGLYVSLTVSENLQEIVTFDPPAMRVAAGVEEIVTVLFAPVEEGEFDGTILLHHNGSNADSPIEIEFHGIGVEGYGSLIGEVIDISDNSSIPGAEIVLSPGNNRTISDENGEYIFEEIPAWTYQVSSNAETFLPFCQEARVEVDDVTEFDIEMLFSLFELDVDVVETPVPIDEQYEENFTAQNRGTGPVAFTAETILPGGAEADPWELREQVSVMELADDNRISGVAYAEGNFYVAGGNNGNQVNLIHIFDHEGNYLESFEQFGESIYGMRDLAWDGTHLWGADGRTVYEFTTDGEQVSSFEGPYNPNYGITWDPDRNLLWICAISNPIVGVDRNGEPQMEVAPRDRIRTSGLAYHPYDPDGYPLYVFSTDGENQSSLFKCDPDENDFVLAADLPSAEGERAGGCEITSEWDPYSWVFVSIMQGNPDMMDIWHIESRRDWVRLDPAEGEIASDGDQEFSLIFDATNLEPDMEMEATLLFSHDGRNDDVELPVAMMVTEEGGFTRRVLDLVMGWNMVSLNIEPEENDVVEITRPLLDDEVLIMVKDGYGHFYRPEFNYNDIPFWDFAQGYQIKVLRECRLEVPGITVASDRAIELEEGWQMVAYYPREAIPERTALSNIVDNLTIAKDGNGHFYLPAWDFSDIGDMLPGQGYQLKMTQGMELIYNRGDAVAQHERAVPEQFTPVIPTGSNMSILLLDADRFKEVAAVSSHGTAGCGVVDESGRVGLAVWKQEVEGSIGFIIGEDIQLIGWDGVKEIPLEVEIQQGSLIYTDDGITVCSVISCETLPTEFAIYQPYPNPFNSVAVLRFDLPETTYIGIHLFDSSGRLVDVLLGGKLEAGRYRRVISAGDLSSGIYFCKLTAGKEIHTTKLVLIR